MYWPLAGEVNLLSLCQGLEARVALPRADGCGHLDYLVWCGNDLEPDGCRIPAPATGIPLKPDQLNLLMIPALSVDTQGYRLGYGGGYYDRLALIRLGRDSSLGRAAVLLSQQGATPVMTGIFLSMVGSPKWDLAGPDQPAHH